MNGLPQLLYPGYTPAMKKPAPAKPVERLFPFVLRSHNLLVGRDTLARSKHKLHFVLITTDISENSRAQILQDFAHYPVVQHYTEADLETHFRVKGAKVVGFQKSGLAQSIYAELKQHRINKPIVKTNDPQPPASVPPAN
ncbi:MAG TPA: hypothetical protein VKA67_12605 [Verrucomicrobiae bacterium]|nr:hypothetical protein [Verrucomicrobiae bacterium]